MSLYDTLMGSWAVEALTWSALAMALVLMLRAPVQRLFGARVAYALWALPALRMVLPRIPGLTQHWRIEMGGAALWSAPAVATPPLPLPADAAPVTFGVVSPEAVPLDALPPFAPAEPAVHWPALLLAAWLGGAALFLLWQLLAHRRFLARAAGGATLVQRDGGITVLSAPGVPGPLATGVLRRLILLPADFTQRYAPAERRLVLAHEVAHHCRGDLIANMAALVVLSLHWFNPLAHRAYRLFRADQELACDETVLSHEPSPEARADYGRAIVRTVARRAPVAACTMHAAGLLKRRLQMMTFKPRGLGRLALGAVAGATLVGGGLATTASGTSTRAEARMPVPPVPPAPPAPPAPVGAVMPVTPPAPPVPRQHLADRGHHVWSYRNNSRHIEIRDGRDIWLNGRKVDPDSVEGRALLAEAEQARREGERAAAEGRRAAEEGRREAERARFEGERAAEEGRRAAEEGRREAERARVEGLRAAEEGRRAAAQARAESIREGQRAYAEAMRDRAEALREAEQARREGTQAAARARYSTYASAYVDRDAINAEVRRSLIQARDEIARDPKLPEKVRADLLRSFNSSIARYQRRN